MPCYGVDTTPIEKAAKAFSQLEDELARVRPKDLASYHRRRARALREAVLLYIDATECWFRILRAIATRSLVLEHDAKRRTRLGNDYVDRSYLEGFLPIYDRALTRSMTALRELVATALTRAPEMASTMVTQTLSSEVIGEYHAFIGVQDGQTFHVVQEHGASGKEIGDSAKKFIIEFILKFIKEYPRLSRSIAKKLRIKLDADTVKNAFHALNEILGMVFRGPKT